LFTYATNDPVNQVDETGLCSDPGGAGGARYCIEAFIPLATFGPFLGDSRGPMPNGGSFRVRQNITPTKGGHGVVSQQYLLGRSVLFAPTLLAHPSHLAHQEVQATPLGVRAIVSASDGVFLSAAPNLRLDFTIVPHKGQPATVIGTHSAFPSFEVWEYQDGRSPQLIYQYNAPATGAYSGLRDILYDVPVFNEHH
jgi:hypothetical protein